MGADLYIWSIQRANEAEYQPKFNMAVQRRDAIIQREGRDSPKIVEAQAEVEKYYELMYSEEGYFRDSYNATSLAWALDFSWWADVSPLLSPFASEDAEGNIDDDDESGNLLFGENLLTFRRMVAKEIQPDVTIERLRSHQATVDDGENSPEKWLEFFEEKRLRLLRFIDTAVALDEPIYCSL